MTLIKIPITGTTASVEIYLSAELDSEEESADAVLEEQLCKRMEVALGKEIKRFIESIGHDKVTILTD